ncbi:MAG TPA: ABC transporter permease [Candidatus Binataceae bacterium]|nr:ABC transporter permease [Candidatus Binataceae bacterium]
MKFLPLIFRNLLRNRRRTLLTVLSIGVSIFIFAALISLPAVVDQILHDSANELRIIVHNKAGFFYALPAAYEPTIRAMPHVMAVSGYAVWVGNYRKAADLVAGVGVDPDALREIWPDWGISAAVEDQLQHVRSGGVANPAMMKRYGWKVGDTITLSGVEGTLEVKILGALGPKGPGNALIMRRDFIDEASPVHGQVILYFIKVDRSDSIPAVISEVDTRFANSQFETTTESEITLALNQLRMFRLLFDGVKILAFIVVIVIGMVAANTAAMAVRERKNELAVMRSLGFNSRTIVAMLLGEGALIGCAGGALGCALAYVALALVPYAGAVLGPFAQILRLLPIVAIESFLIATAIGLLSATVPAILAMRRDIASELRAL